MLMAGWQQITQDVLYACNVCTVCFKKGAAYLLSFERLYIHSDDSREVLLKTGKGLFNTKHKLHK